METLSSSPFYKTKTIPQLKNYFWKNSVGFKKYKEPQMVQNYTLGWFDM